MSEKTREDICERCGKFFKKDELEIRDNDTSQEKQVCSKCDKILDKENDMEIKELLQTTLEC